MNDFPFQIVGCDLDGTLLDTHADLGAALNHALIAAGRAAVPVEQVRDLIGGGARMMLERALTVTGGILPEADLRELHNTLLEYYRANIAVHSRLFPGGVEMLNALDARGVKVAVVTNKMESLAVQLLDELGLSPRLATIIGGDTLGRGRAKPEPDLLYEMCARLGPGRVHYHICMPLCDARCSSAASRWCKGAKLGARGEGAAAVILPTPLARRTGHDGDDERALFRRPVS